MGRISIPVTVLSRAGVAPAAGVVSSSTIKHAVPGNNGSVWLKIVSTDAGSQYIDAEIPQTVDGQPVTSKRVTVAAGATIYAGPWPTSVYNQTAIAADGTLTSDATAPSNNDTVTIGVAVYTYKTTLTGAAFEVLIGANAAAALTNLKSAINATAGAGTTYGTGTTANGSVTAGTLTATTLQVTATTAGAAGNTIATTETSSHLVWGAATLAGGFDDGALLLDPSISTTLTIYAFSIA